MCWCNNKKKIFYIFFIKETVTRSCSARVTFVLRLLHVRVTLVTRSCSTRYTYVQRFLRQPVLTNYYGLMAFFRRLSCFPNSNVM